MAKRKKEKFLISEFYCTYCGKKGLPVIRKEGRKREGGHLKKLYCLNCQKETNHVEICPNSDYTYENFLQEYSNGNFINGLRKESGD